MAPGLEPVLGNDDRRRADWEIQEANLDDRVSRQSNALSVGDRTMQHGLRLRSNVDGTVNLTADRGTNICTAGGEREHTPGQQYSQDCTARIVPTLRPMCHATLFLVAGANFGASKPA